MYCLWGKHKLTPIEYSSIVFAAFFLGEYANILLMSSLFCLLFLGGWQFSGAFKLIYDWIGITPQIFAPLIFCTKIVFIGFIFIFVRSNLPRYRFDQLMTIGWKVFLPFSFGLALLYIGLLITFNITVHHQKPFTKFNSFFLIVN